jgi:hypothetical protein
VGGQGLGAAEHVDEVDRDGEVGEAGDAGVAPEGAAGEQRVDRVDGEAGGVEVLLDVVGGLVRVGVGAEDRDRAGPVEDRAQLGVGGRLHAR